MKTTATPKKEISPLQIDNTAMKKAAMVVRALNHDLRQKIIRLIHANGTMTVTTIYRKIKEEQSVTSTHLAILRHSGLVVCSRDGHYMHYSVNYKRIKEINQFVKDLLVI
ncbi:MAG: ArsR/SmtB family transcription factor [Candidatus Dadabacteria bacterium]